MKKATLEWIEIAEGDWNTATRESRVEDNPNYKAVSFHAQQCGEKYLKAIIQDFNADPQRTHDLTTLLHRVLSFRPNLDDLHESCVELTYFAVDHRYPGTTTSRNEAALALRHASVIREKVRGLFGLPV
ncbi:MAG: HEPN domain-containing protein [Pyrinomonadaceae bacterium]|nr:HEPN domain-containing protein [Pyrinomonadaceae bacterium]